MPPADALVLQGPLLPGLVDAHGHAFQRAFAGRAERRDALTDDFWSWRDRMYRVALRISQQVRNATIVFIVCDRGDRYLSTGVFPA